MVSALSQALTSTNVHIPQKIKDGTVAQVAVPVATGLYSLAQKDYRGVGILCLAMLVNQLVIEGVKRLFPRVRPNNHHRPNSFPSGHTQAAFLGSAALIQRYGWQNVPLVFTVSSFVASVSVGVSRYIYKAHWISDIVAGALFGIALSFGIKPLQS